MAKEYAVKKYDKVPPKPQNISRYPFKNMEVGDSFVVPFNEVASVASLRVSACVTGKRLQFKFRVFIDKELDPNAYRVIRIK
jgi:hypothetical protein